MQKYFFLFVLSLLSLLPHQAFAVASEASVSVVPAITQLSIDNEQQQLLFSFSLRNDHPQPIDVRSVTFGNIGDLSLEAVLTDIALVNSQGEEVSTRIRYYEDWSAGGDLLSSSVQVQVLPQEIPIRGSEEYQFRAVVKGGVDESYLQFITDSVSVLVPGSQFVRDLYLEASDLDQKLVFDLGGEEASYNPIVTSLEDSNLKPDLVVEEVYFAEEYGYQKDVIVVPVCNAGNGPTQEGQRIEGEVRTSENYLRDFIIRKSLAAGKCFEQVFSAKRDLRINKAASHTVWVQLDPQNAIGEERENNNERQDLVVIVDPSVETNSVVITNQPLSIRQRILAQLGLTRARPNVAEVNENTSDDRKSSSRLRTNTSLKSEIIDNDNYIVHPNYGEESKYLGTKATQDIFAPVENDIIREELPESAEDLWNDTQWERESAPRTIEFNRQRLEEKEAPTNVIDSDLVPTFREPNAVNRYRTSYRGLRSGVRTDTDFRGGRTNNDPVLSSERDLTAFCEDPDGLNIYEQGTVRYKSRVGQNIKTATDVTRGNYVLEYYCDGSYMRRQLFECDEGSVGDGFCTQ